MAQTPVLVISIVTSGSSSLCSIWASAYSWLDRHEQQSVSVCDRTAADGLGKKKRHPTKTVF